MVIAGKAGRPWWLPDEFEKAAQVTVEQGSGKVRPDQPAGPAMRETTALAHDLNNVFTVILGGVALADRHVAGNGRIVALLENMRMAAERGAWLVQQMVVDGRDQHAEDRAGHDADRTGSPDSLEDGLPAARAGAGTGGTATNESAGMRDTVVHTRRILVVEDDADVAYVAVAVLEGLGHDVNHAENAPAALALLQEQDYDLVFSDIVMPGGMSGIELAESIRVSHPDLPVLLATGFSGAALRPGALRFPVLAKPYSVRELSSQVSKLLA